MGGVNSKRLKSRVGWRVLKSRELWVSLENCDLETAADVFWVLFIIRKPTENSSLETNNPKNKDLRHVERMTTKYLVIEVKMLTARITIFNEKVGKWACDVGGENLGAVQGSFA